ncbi:MAG TPA: hypothetical protein VLS90_17895, partial [Thermodesulfobacteriota bacterium]|nr:hypothetical protein [Thermodesulfobacteriota bacterium]
MISTAKPFLAGTVLLICLFIPLVSFAQEVSPAETSQQARFFASGGSSYQFKSDVTGGGDFSLTRYSVALGGGGPIEGGVGAGFGITYDYEDYDFSNVRGFPVSNPWSKIDRVGVNVRLNYKLTDAWTAHMAPMVQYAGERGADFGDSLIYGGMVGASYRVSRDLLVGFGLGAFYRLEETRVFPSLIISWRINDRLRLGNSYRLGPAGPAGLELTYALDKQWDLGLGAGYRSSRFRLDENGPIRSGIGENDSWPVY